MPDPKPPPYWKVALARGILALLAAAYMGWVIKMMGVLAALKAVAFALTIIWVLKWVTDILSEHAVAKKLEEKERDA